MKVLRSGAALSLLLVLACVSCGGDDGEDSGSDQPSASASKSPSKSPSESPTKKPSKTMDEADAWAAEMEADLLDALGVKSFQQTCPDISWSCPISDVSADAVGTLMVTEQVNGLSKDEAKRWAVNVLNFVGEDHEELEWVVIQDASGTVAGQAQRSDAPLLGLSSGE